MKVQPRKDKTISQEHDMAASSSSTAPRFMSKTATNDDNMRTNDPAGPKPIAWQHNYFATWLSINLVCWFIISGLGSGSVTIPSEGQAIIGGFASFIFAGSFLGTLIMVEEVWSQTSHTRMLAGTMGLGLTATYALMGEGWNNGWHRTAVALSGGYVGFVLESATGVFGLLLQGLANTGEPQDPAVVTDKKG
ncbi:hypothetical protein CGGC5_v000481 [Colletotrichum fructicola Nara gc5]|uniref:Uncharacterized protein n=1 Tax=Colletotrichum fructicola (strain Nara gc5) TaxID=1213859 RepID=A0A7J6JS46_COLFN|nr:hypothetical protein CFRS1_v007770 [Colletotrichum fructicola]KAF4492552.1 hypothetical protein CGGC5_v000481 [Colletotrichum fructicola Nara gc5]KAF4904762.1 hypothetical protein CGCFRS4_v000916 [Colletotrichum fructicola]KAF4933493.1 hypothetical protein CGCF245_v009585 [Colletotrichum fructicola]KAF5514393.1 hypothetical protein CGCF413_v000457 [Colletotrichum fructicola]